MRSRSRCADTESQVPAKTEANWEVLPRSPTARAQLIRLQVAQESRKQQEEREAAVVASQAVVVLPEDEVLPFEVLHEVEAASEALQEAEVAWAEVRREGEEAALVEGEEVVVTRLYHMLKACLCMYEAFQKYPWGRDRHRDQSLSLDL